MTRLRVALLEGARVAEVRREARVGLLADRAGVEDEHVGVVLGGRLAQAELLEQALDPLGVVSVHLAAEGANEVTTHRTERSSAPRRAERAGACSVNGFQAPQCPRHAPFRPKLPHYCRDRHRSRLPTGLDCLGLHTSSAVATHAGMCRLMVSRRHGYGLSATWSATAEASGERGPPGCSRQRSRSAHQPRDARAAFRAAASSRSER